MCRHVNPCVYLKDKEKEDKSGSEDDEYDDDFSDDEEEDEETKKDQEEDVSVRGMTDDEDKNKYGTNFVFSFIVIIFAWENRNFYNLQHFLQMNNFSLILVMQIILDCNESNQTFIVSL